jgi:DHA1 family chloramphenicol resistance protein-like MFS transporter
LLGTAAGWRTTFWAIALLCIPALIGILLGVPKNLSQADADAAAPMLRTELGQLGSPGLLLAMALGALVNGGTFAAFTFLAPVVTETAGLPDAWISVALVMFGVGSFLGVTVAGRLSDHRPGIVLAVGGPLLMAGWIALALVATHPVLLMGLILSQGALAFGVGSTLIARVLYAASNAPTMGGSYATAALNAGAAAGPVLGALALGTGAGALAPIWVAAALTAAALVVMLLWERALTRPAPVATR